MAAQGFGFVYPATESSIVVLVSAANTQQDATSLLQTDYPCFSGQYDLECELPSQ